MPNFTWNRPPDSQILVNPKFLHFGKILHKGQIALKITIVHVEILKLGKIGNLCWDRRHVVRIVTHDEICELLEIGKDFTPEVAKIQRRATVIFDYKESVHV